MQPGPSRPLSTRSRVRRAKGRRGAPPLLYGSGPRGPASRCREDPLAAKSQVLHHLSVAFDLGGFEVVQQSPALSDHAEQAATRRVVALVDFEVLGEVVDLLGEQGDLYLRRTGIALVRLEFLDDAQLLFLGQRQGHGS